MRSDRRDRCGQVDPAGRARPGAGRPRRARVGACRRGAGLGAAPAFAVPDRSRQLPALLDGHGLVARGHAGAPARDRRGRALARVRQRSAREHRAAARARGAAGRGARSARAAGAARPRRPAPSARRLRAPRTGCSARCVAPMPPGARPSGACRARSRGRARRRPTKPTGGTPSTSSSSWRRRRRGAAPWPKRAPG